MKSSKYTCGVPHSYYMAHNCIIKKLNMEVPRTTSNTYCKDIYRGTTLAITISLLLYH